jgi:BirA family biotin operon repressor/biotin-[acetyl-CoA-carboxylase] ligase
MTNGMEKRAGGLWGGKVIHADRLDSTNTWALDHLAELQEGDVVHATVQTAGRGRFERAWLAVPGKCLTLSLVLKHPAWIPLGPNLGQVAAWAMVEMLAGFGIRACLKWPNDVMVDDRKVAGILVERGLAADGFVVGIGLNVNVSASELRQGGLDRPATSLAEAVGHAFDLNEVMTALAGELQCRLDEVRACGLPVLWHAWARADWLRGRSIRLQEANGEVTTGEYLGITDAGGLRVRTLEGYERVYWSGDIERVVSA